MLHEVVGLGDGLDRRTDVDAECPAAGPVRLHEVIHLVKLESDELGKERIRVLTAGRLGEDVSFHVRGEDGYQPGAGRLACPPRSCEA